MQYEELCLRCSFRNPSGFHFCGQCGAALLAAPPERRQLTVAFCDLVGSVRLSEQLDSEELHDVIAEYHNIAEEVFTRHGGFIGQFLGDGVLVYFGWPHVLEKAAEQAVRAGLAFLATIAARNATHGSGAIALQVRMALHTGPVIVGDLGTGSRHQEAGIAGHTSNLAARLQTIAPAGGLVLSDATRKLLPEAFVIEDLGHILMKGFGNPVRVFQVLGVRDAASQSREIAAQERTPLVGREPILAAVKQAWAAVESGAGLVLHLRGEAGSGKSRIVREFHRAIGEAPHRWLLAQATESTCNSSFEPIIELGRRMGVGGEVSASENFADVCARLVDVDLFPEDAAVLVAVSGKALPPGVPLPAMPPDALRARGIALMVEMLRRRARQMPVVFVIEDLHWADASTLTFLRTLVESGVPPRMLLITSTRPEFTPPWAGETHTLERLPDAEARQLVELVAGGRWFSAALLAEIVARGDGVPLYLEEITRAVLDEAESADISAPAPSLVPATLRDSIRARLDRLGPAREVAQLAAVIGRDFSEPMLREVWAGDPAELPRQLERLMEAGIVARSPAGYSFRHALIQAEAYESILIRTRRTHHERLARRLAARSMRHFHIAPEILAHHFTLAGWQRRSIPFWVKAARLAAGRHAHVEAAAHVTQALALLHTQQPGEGRDAAELSLQLMLAVSLAATTGYASREMEQLTARLMEMKDLPMPLPQAVHLHAAVAACALARHRWALGEEMGRWMIAVGRRSGLRTIEGSGEVYQGVAGFYQGRLADADTSWQRAVEWCEPVSVFALNNQLAACGWRALALCLRGMEAECHAALDVARGFASESKRPNDLGFVMHIEQCLRLYRGEAESIAQMAAEFTAFMREHGLSHWLAMTLPLHGWATVRVGRTEEGLAAIRRALAGFATLGQRLAGTNYHYCLADALRFAGRAREAIEALAVAEEFVRAGEIVYVPMLRRTEADAWRELGDADKARRCLLAGRDIAAAMGEWLLHAQIENDLAALDSDDAGPLIPPDTPHDSFPRSRRS